MQQFLNLTGSIAAVLGILLCVISGLARLFGLYHLAGYQSTTLFIVGTGVMVFACLVKLEALSAKSRN
jgi:type IV secretory pathway VirB2 component (pilin)